jgi:VCBS repeat-containing protein
MLAILRQNLLNAVKISSLANSGTLKLNNAAVAAGDFVSVADINGGKLTFVPAPNASGAANFTFQVQDNGGTTSGGADLDLSPNTITFNVAPVNDAPAGTDKSISLLEDNSYTLTAADFGFTDPNDTPANAFSAVKISSLVAAGSLKLNGTAVAVGDLVTVTDIIAGNLKFTPAANANGNNYANFTFQVKDDGGVVTGIDLDATPNTITFNVTSVNDAPVITVGATDKATGGVTEIADGALGENARNLNVNGTLTITDVDLADVQAVAVIPKGTPYAGTFTPVITDGTTGDGKGQINWSFSVADKDIDSLAAGQVLTQTYTIIANDGQGGIANQDVTITLNGTNDAPTVIKPIKKETIGEGQALKFTIPADTFQDVDAGDKLTYSATLKDGKPLPKWLILNPLTGEFSGTPTGTSAGEYNIKVIATDIAGATANTILSLKVLDFIGGKGNDKLDGTDYAETLEGGEGDDTIAGKAGDDCLEGGKGNDTLNGGDGHDKLKGGTGNDKLFGEVGNDNLEGGAGDDTLVGGKGDDTLLGNAGNDYLEGSEGNDTYVFDLSTAQGKDRIEEAVKGGYDEIVFEGTGNVKIDLSMTTAQNINANLVLTVINLEDVTGSSGNDLISGNSSNNILAGGAGNDTLKGGKGDDAFVFGSRSITTIAAMGIDKIVDFAPTVDEIWLDKAAFTRLGTLAGNNLLASDFEIVKKDSAVATSAAAIVYSSGSGKLFYNENGISAGLGLGGQFAELTKNLNLTSNDFTAIS